MRGTGHRPVVQLDGLQAFGLAVNVETQVGGFRAEQAPGHEHTVRLADGHDATAQVFHLALGGGVRSEADAQAQQQALEYDCLFHLVIIDN